MLEKLIYSKERYQAYGTEHIQKDVFSDSNSYDSDSMDFRIAFQNHLSKTLQENVILYETDRGRLGVTYSLRIQGRRLFCKTHKCGDQFKKSIEKEYFYLKRAYPYFDVKLDNFTFDGYEYKYMLQEWLECTDAITPDMALNLISAYSNELEKQDDRFEMITYSIQDLVNIAKEELPFLVDIKELTYKCSDELKQNINAFANHIPVMRKAICHGDFGDKNILVSSKGEYIAVDWEDCFVGVEGYDYLYWLTFFNHRNFYLQETFKASGLNSDDAKGILTVIMVIKTALSIYSGLNKNNSVSSQDRIKEILQYCNY